MVDALIPNTPQAQIAPNSYAFETTPLIKPTGFREYDARWWFGGAGHDMGPELNPHGVRALGEGTDTLMHESGVDPVIAVGHDFRHYSKSIKMTLFAGLMYAGIKALDFGLALSPMAYFAQFHIKAAGVAMVTAIHNFNAGRALK